MAFWIVYALELSVLDLGAVTTITRMAGLWPVFECGHDRLCAGSFSGGADPSASWLGGRFELQKDFPWRRIQRGDLL